MKPKGGAFLRGEPKISYGSHTLCTVLRIGFAPKGFKTRPRFAALRWLPGEGRSGQLHHAEIKTLGFFCAICRSRKAAPDGLRRFFSQLLTVSVVTFKYAAKTGVLALSVRRMRAIVAGDIVCVARGTFVVFKVSFPCAWDRASRILPSNSASLNSTSFFIARSDF